MRTTDFINSYTQTDEEAKPGLYANIHAKRERIKHGSKERMRKPGSKGAPTAQAWKDAAKTAKKESIEEGVVGRAIAKGKDLLDRLDGNPNPNNLINQQRREKQEQRKKQNQQQNQQGVAEAFADDGKMSWDEWRAKAIQQGAVKFQDTDNKTIAYDKNGKQVSSITWSKKKEQGVAEATEQSLQKKIDAKQDALGLARERRKMSGKSKGVQSDREVKLSSEIANLRQELHILKNKQGVAEGHAGDPYAFGDDDYMDLIQGMIDNNRRNMSPSRKPRVLAATKRYIENNGGVFDPALFDEIYDQIVEFSRGIDEAEGIDDGEDCDLCNGTGEGMYDGESCPKCHGTGVLPHQHSDDDFDEPDNYRDDDYGDDESYYEKYVRTRNLEENPEGSGRESYYAKYVQAKPMEEGDVVKFPKSAGVKAQRTVSGKQGNVTPMPKRTKNPSVTLTRDQQGRTVAQGRTIHDVYESLTAAELGQESPSANTPQAQAAAKALQAGMLKLKQQYPGLDTSFESGIVKEIRPDGTVVVAAGNGTGAITRLMALGGGANFKVVAAQMEENEDPFAPSQRAKTSIAASGWRRGGSMNGTSLRGYVNATYDQIESVFGKPIYGPDDNGDKVTCEWVITFKDGQVATIYDWKTGSTPRDLYRWHVGGVDPSVVDRVASLLGTEPSQGIWEGRTGLFVDGKLKRVFESRKIADTLLPKAKSWFPDRTVELQPLAEDATGGASCSSAVASVVGELGEGGMTKRQVNSKLSKYTNIARKPKPVKVRGGY